jgi:alanyl-tRNA synthetase
MNQNQVAATETTVASTETTTTVTEVAAPAAKKAKAAAKKTATKVAKPAKEKTATVAVVRADTKKFQAIAIVSEGLAAGTARKDVLTKLQTELKLSAAGSNTYFQNVKSKKAGWTA